MAKKNDETNGNAKTELVSLELEIKEVTPWEPEMSFDLRQIIGLSDKDLLKMKEQLQESMDEVTGNTEYSEIAQIRKALLAPEVIRDKDGGIVTQNDPISGRPMATNKQFDLDDQRVRNRLLNCIEGLTSKLGKKKSVTIQFCKHAELAVPNWDDAIILAKIMKTYLNEQNVLGQWIPDFYSKISTMEKEAKDLLGNKK